MARVILVEPVDGDTADIVDDLGGKAGANVADRYVVEFDKVYGRLEEFLKLDRVGQS